MLIFSEQAMSVTTVLRRPRVPVASRQLQLPPEDVTLNGDNCGAATPFGVIAWRRDEVELLSPRVAAFSNSAVQCFFGHINESNTLAAQNDPLRQNQVGNRRDHPTEPSACIVDDTPGGGFAGSGKVE